MRRGAIALLGGSFNPAHAGHLHVSWMALRVLGVSEVWWLVSPQNPLKPAIDMAPLAWRLARARAVATSCRQIIVSDIETRLGTRYAVDTIGRLRQCYPHRRFIWLMGAGNLVQMPCWWRWPRLFYLVPVAVLARYPYSLRALASAAARRFARWRVSPLQARVLARRKPPGWVFLSIRPHPDSATRIRAASGLWWEREKSE